MPANHAEYREGDMFTYRRLIKLSCCLVLAGLALAACQAQTPTPERIQEKIIETVVVTEIVEREGEKVIETIIVTVEPKAGVEEPAEQGPRTLVICMGSEPNSLYVYESGMASSSAIRQAIYDGPFDNNSFAYQPVILEKLPNLADGDAVLQTVSVSVGEKITDSSGEVAELAEGMLVKTAGCTSMDCAVEYEDGELLMDQLVVTFKLLPGITWSDGTPLTAHDSVFSFAKYMGPGNTSGRYWGERTGSYEALDDLTVVWTGLPGFLDATYYTSFWDPLPEHVLGQYTDAELEEAEDANRLPLGWGAYIIDEWVQGDRITLHKNPNYWRADEGLPKFDRLVFRFVGQNSNANIASLLAGECDIVLSQLDDQSKLLLELDDAGRAERLFCDPARFGNMPILTSSPLGRDTLRPGTPMGMAWVPLAMYGCVSRLPCALTARRWLTLSCSDSLR